MKTYLLCACFIFFGISGCDLKLAGENAQEGSDTWKMDTVKSVGGFPTLVVGNPEVVDTSVGLALLFDGREDGLQINSNPIINAETFTVEVVFRPDQEGNLEQTLLHIREVFGDNSVQLEIHNASDQWFLHSSLQSNENFIALESDSLLHSFGNWYHVAFVYDGEMVRQYVNGREELSGPLPVSRFERGRTALGMNMDLVGWFKGAMLATRFTPRAIEPKNFMKR